MTQLLRLRGVTFEYRDSTAIHEKAGRQAGFIAQEVEKVFPQWVTTGADGYKSVGLPTGFSAITVEAIREQQSQIESLKAENQRLKREIAAIWAELKKRR